MKVRTRLYISSIFISLLAMSVLFVIEFSTKHVEQITQNHSFARDVQVSISRLNIVMYEYLLSKKERAREQWKLKYDSITSQLDTAKKDGKHEELIELIYDEFESLGKLFEKVYQNNINQGQFVKKGASIALMAATMELEDQVTDQLLIKSHSIIQDASRIANTSLEALNEAQRGVERFIFTFVILVIFGVTFSSSAVTRNITNPIAKLIRGTNEFGGGNLDYRIRLAKKDEFGQLAHSFNTMSHSLKEKIDDLAETNRELKEKNDQMRHELEIATRVHRTLIPESVYTEKANISVNYLPIGYIGGDYAKFHFLNDNRLIFIISDVTGHGVGAALLVNRLHSEFERLAKLGLDPGPLLKELNNFITELFEGTAMYLSAFCGCLNFSNNEFQYSNHGHPPQYIYHINKQSLEPMESQTTLLGIPFQDDEVHQHEISFNKGDKIILFTDGIIESKNSSGEFFGTGRMEDFLKGNYNLSADQLNKDLLGNVDEFSGGDFGDDVFLLTIHIK